MSLFKQAKRANRKLRVAFDGPPGSGKSYSGLRLAFAAKKAGFCTRIAAIDTENESLSLYAGEAPDGEPWQFETLNLREFSPTQYEYAIKEAEKEGIDMLFIDSLSHAWIGKGGTLDMVDKKGGGGTAWKDITPIQRQMVDTIIQCKMHVIATLRSKMDYVFEPDPKTGKITPRKIGMAPIQREGLEYEFDLYSSFDNEHLMSVTKTRCSAMDGVKAMKPGPETWAPFFDWFRGIDNTSPEPAFDESREFEAMLALIQNASSRAELNGPIADKLKTVAAKFPEASLAALRATFGERLKAFK